jgi:hypothetical protein
MKNTKSIIAIIVLAVLATAVAVVSCKKEKQELTSNKEEQSSLCFDNMDEYLISFKKKLLSAQKGDETISLEQAQRDLGNLLNFDFGDADHPTDVYHVDTIHIKLTLNQGEVDLSQLANTYNEAFNSILDTYHSIDLPEKSISAILCTFNKLVTKEGENEDVEFVVVTRGFIEDTIMPSNNHDTLDWRPDNNAGTCDGQFNGVYGAPEILSSWIRHSQGIPSCPNGRVYYSDEGTWITYGYSHYDPTTEQFLIYTSFETNQDSVCIPHEDMEYYYQNILDIYHQQPFGNHHMNYVGISHQHLHGPIPALNNQYYWYYCWRVTIKHGKPNCTEVPPVN